MRFVEDAEPLTLFRYVTCRNGRARGSGRGMALRHQYGHAANAQQSVGRELLPQARPDEIGILAHRLPPYVPFDRAGR